MTDSKPVVYARQLYPENYGYPLYSPEPYSNSSDYLSQGIFIGDVGYITYDGAFETLFNVRFEASHPRNQVHGVPDGFQPLDIPDSSVVLRPNYHGPDCQITRQVSIRRSFGSGVSVSDTVTTLVGASASGSYSQGSNEGAFLHLPNGASRWDCWPNLFRDYAIAQAHSWYRFTQERHLHDDISLYLITGCDKTNSWALGAYSDAPSQHEVELEISAMQLAGGHIQYGYQSHRGSPIQIRTSRSTQGFVNAPQQYIAPSLLFGDPDNPLESSLIPIQPPSETQCVFVRGFKVSVRPHSLLKRKRIEVEIGSTESMPKYLEPGYSFPSSFSGLGRFTNVSPSSPSPGPSQPSTSGRGGRETANLQGFAFNFELEPTIQGDDQSANTEDRAADVVLEHVPRVSENWHPAGQWNEFLFSKCPGATVALTHDDDIFELDRLIHTTGTLDRVIVAKDGGVYFDLSSAVNAVGVQTEPESSAPSTSLLPDDPSQLRSILEDIAQDKSRVLSEEQQGLVTLALQTRMAEIVAFGETPGKRIGNRTSLRIQEIAKRKRKRNTKLFMCFLCGADYTSKQNLSKHILAHYRIKMIKCGNCGARLAGDIARHQRSCAGRRRNQK